MQHAGFIHITLHQRKGAEKELPKCADERNECACDGWPLKLDKSDA